MEEFYNERRNEWEDDEDMNIDETDNPFKNVCNERMREKWELKKTERNKTRNKFSNRDETCTEKKWK